MNKIVCYTCIVNSYDTLKDPMSISDDIDYICFSDYPVKSNIWKWMPIPSELRNLNKIKQQRIVKICPHRYLSNYDISIWIDGSFQISGNLHKFIDAYNLDVCSIYTRIHPTRNCIYEEANACIQMNRGIIKIIIEQTSKYKKEGYPKNIGMVESGILLRRHNERECIIIDNLWAAEVLEWSHRDQLSFNYVCWKNNFIPGCLNNEFNLLDNSFFKYYGHR